MHLQLNFKILLFQTTYNEVYPILLLKTILYRDYLEREREKKIQVWNPSYKIYINISVRG